ncbi:hypothetical protein [Pedobacter sp. SYP-B3415]|uniref:hypothetical protein n=1 Tax=Pedobacter sp. SYP-B3415 TaxID=2496641 RepID=UPI00101E11B1|nr:hypothetical protein [Pedobacter sp. SYP-B3415]
MKPSTSIKLRDTTIAALIAEDQTRADLLRSEFKIHAPQLAEVINAYLSERYRVAEQTEFGFTFATKFSGHVLVSFVASQYNACESLELTHADNRRLDFDIDPASHTLTLTGDMLRERSTFEEF